MFEVKSKGASVFPYVLVNGAFRIQLSEGGCATPMAYVQISSDYLSQNSPVDAAAEATAVISELRKLTESPNVSRVDLFVDFATSENMEGWDRHGWVTRAEVITAYAVARVFSGWSVGSGGALSARLYYKQLEIKESGKTYLFDLWRQAGWSGNLPVWRLEFQLRRDVLTKFQLSKLPSVLANLDGLWSYATTEWLRLTLPSSSDQTRARWPLHPTLGISVGDRLEGAWGPAGQENFYGQAAFRRTTLRAGS